MTHILILFDGQVGKWDNLKMFLKWINSLSYPFEDKSYSVEPRIMVPINLRICSKVKDQLLSDLKKVGSNPKTQKQLDRLPRWGTGIKKIDMSKIKKSTKDIKVKGFAKNIHFGYANIIGEVEDGINKWGEENL